MRGKLSRKFVETVKQALSLRLFTRTIDVKHPENHNPEVQEILKKQGPYDYGKPVNDGVRRVGKPAILLENKTKYEG
jgi:hypothetical protein